MRSPALTCVHLASAHVNALLEAETGKEQKMANLSEQIIEARAVLDEIYRDAASPLHYLKHPRHQAVSQAVSQLEDELVRLTCTEEPIKAKGLQGRPKNDIPAGTRFSVGPAVVVPPTPPCVEILKNGRKKGSGGLNARSKEILGYFAQGKDFMAVLTILGCCRHALTDWLKNHPTTCQKTTDRPTKHRREVNR